MRFRFLSIDRPKRAAKAISSVVQNASLSDAQRAVAKVTGYRDWHELEQECPTTSPSPLDDTLMPDQFEAQFVSMALDLAEELLVPWTDAVYALSISRLTGDRALDSEQHRTIWLRAMQAVHLPSGKRRSTGQVVRVNAPGWRGKRVILKSFGRPSLLVTDKSVDASCGDSEVVSPRTPLPLFIPMRLYLAYGIWVENDESKVLFSRDYAPMWRLRQGRRPERLAPWTWINFVDQDWFWGDLKTPWHYPNVSEREERRLLDYGIYGLPKVVDVLPIALFVDHSVNETRAIKIMEDDPNLLRLHRHPRSTLAHRISPKNRPKTRPV